MCLWLERPSVYVHAPFVLGVGLCLGCVVWLCLVLSCRCHDGLFCYSCRLPEGEGRGREEMHSVTDSLGSVQSFYSISIFCLHTVYFVSCLPCVCTCICTVCCQCVWSTCTAACRVCCDCRSLYCVMWPTAVCLIQYRSGNVTTTPSHTPLH